MPVRDDLGKRMKEYYEAIQKTRLVRRMPVCIRLDGKAFHTFTRGFQKPFDDLLIKTMQETMKHLCKNIQGCVLGYTQSDEITLILVDYKKLTSQAWYDYEVQKLCSIAASMCTMKFNNEFSHQVRKYKEEHIVSDKENKKCWNSIKDTYYQTIYKAMNNGAMFDARCFNIPKEEVCNLLYWRQLDATRNSIQMLGQSQFSHKELQNKSCNDIQDMLMTKRNINWNNLDTVKKRGSCCVRNEKIIENNGVTKTVELRDISKNPKEWIVDKEIPIFSKDRSYVESLIDMELYG